MKNEEEILGNFFIYNKSIRTKIVTLVIPEKGRLVLLLFDIYVFITIISR